MMKRLLQDRWIGILLIVLVLASFSGVVENGFVDYDDQLYVTQNDRVQAGLTWEGILRAFTAPQSANWHPLTMLSHMLDCQIFGLNPAGHHMTSLLLHAANTLLLFLFLREATGRRWESALAAALFGIHPLHVESVAWISERKDVLSGFFGILALLAYVRYVRNPNLIRYGATLCFFSLGLLSKPMLVTIPLLFFLLDFWPLGRFQRSDERSGQTFFQKAAYYHAIIIEKIPFLILSLISSAVTTIVQAKAGAMSTLDAIPLDARIVNAMVSCCKYLEQTFWPMNLAVFYPHSYYPLRVFSSPLEPQIIGAAAVFLLVTATVLLLIRRHPYALTGWLWYCVTLLPVIGIVQVGLQSMADRYMYLPSIGIFVLAVWSISSVSRTVHNRRAILSVASVAVLAILSLVTWQQVGHWRNTKTLFQRAADVTSDNWLAHRMLGDVLLLEGDLSTAEQEFRKALAIWPAYAEGHSGLARFLEKKGRSAEALESLQKTLRIDRKNAQAYIDKGNILQKQGKKEQALASYAAAEGLIPDNSWAHNALGIAFAESGHLDRAMVQFKMALTLAPQRADTHNNIGRVLNLKEKPAEALPFLLTAITLKPNFPEAYNNTGLVLLKTGNLEKAAYYFSAALLLKPDYEKARGNLRLLAAAMVHYHPEQK
jgi:tetratricopeptide (TPR) repeat protein